MRFIKRFLKGLIIRLALQVVKGTDKEYYTRFIVRPRELFHSQKEGEDYLKEMYIDAIEGLTRRDQLEYTISYLDNVNKIAKDDFTFYVKESTILLNVLYNETMSEIKYIDSMNKMFEEVEANENE